jgi:hypothetical protein
MLWTLVRYIYSYNRLLFQGRLRNIAKLAPNYVIAGRLLHVSVFAQMVISNPVSKDSDAWQSNYMRLSRHSNGREISNTSVTR